MTMLPLALSTRYNTKANNDVGSSDDFFLPLTSAQASVRAMAKDALIERLTNTTSNIKGEARRELEQWANATTGGLGIRAGTSLLEKPVSGMYRYGPAYHENAEAERLLRKKIWMLAEQRSRTIAEIDIDKSRFIETQKMKMKRMPRLLSGVNLDRYQLSTTSAGTTVSRMKKQRNMLILLKIEICEAHLVQHVKEHSKRRLLAERGTSFITDVTTDDEPAAIPQAEMNDEEAVNVLAYRDFVKLKKSGLITEIRSSFYDDYVVDGHFREELYYCAKLLETLCIPICQKRCPVMMGLLRTHRHLSELLQSPTPALVVSPRKLADYQQLVTKVALRDHYDVAQSLSAAPTGKRDPDQVRKNKVLAVINRLEHIRKMPTFSNRLNRDKTEPVSDD